tara:strand:+ start:1916 stop:2494 length:579 start_codon:yes stop_codon:yes gene_type:complete
VRSDFQVLREYIKEVCGGKDASNILQTAEKAHSGQMRRSGEPYIEHPIAVANIIKQYYPGEQLLCTAALLHDTLEDAIKYGNYVDENELVNAITSSYSSPSEGKHVLQILYLLTHEPGADYSKYVLSLSDNPGALKIKLADMLHNLSSSPHKKQALKYLTALNSLELKYSGIPPEINPAHWSQLQDIIKTVS